MIGDVHGHYDRLLALLVKAGIVDAETEERIPCDDGDCVEVVQLGDLGDFRYNPTGDVLCYEKARDWFDVLLWGNHDRAAIDETIHGFQGQAPMSRHMQHAFETVRNSGLMRLAWEAHGFLLTHAGLHAHWFNRSAGAAQIDFDGDVSKLATELTLIEFHNKRHPVIDSISSHRGGRDPAGGVLWRDTREKLAPVSQVFGHTRGDNLRTYYNSTDTKGYCIDVGRKDNGRLMGIWLPEERIVEVKVPQQNFSGVGCPE